MECSTKVFVEGALGMKAHMSQAVGCLVIIFQADDIKSSKKLTVAFPRFCRQLILSTMNRRSVYEKNQIHCRVQIRGC